MAFGRRSFDVGALTPTLSQEERETGGLLQRKRETRSLFTLRAFLPPTGASRCKIPSIDPPQPDWKEAYRGPTKVSLLPVLELAPARRHRAEGRQHRRVSREPSGLPPVYG